MAWYGGLKIGELMGWYRGKAGWTRGNGGGGGNWLQFYAFHFVKFDAYLVMAVQ